MDCARDILRHEGGLLALWRVRNREHCIICIYTYIPRTTPVGASVRVCFFLVFLRSRRFARTPGMAYLYIPTKHQIQGLVPTLCRDAPGVGAWFLGFAWGKDALLRRKQQRLRQKQQERQQEAVAAATATATAGPASPPGRLEPGGVVSLSVWELLLAGSTAGVAFWTVALPFDTVKSVIQVQPHQPQKEKMWAVARRLVREEGGVRRLFRGWQGAFGRAVPGSAATLAVFDIVKEKL